ncbi:hypothetical protein ACFV6Y_39490 [Streptomyces massasporeus]|uniref:DUF7433 family protein n=1 Tax=Streptomyces massasporeus TaxID=67324 RepID=UPI00364B3408
MSGSLDDQSVEVINVENETVLAVLFYPDGRCRVNSANSDPKWVAEMLRRLADQHDPDGGAPVKLRTSELRRELDMLQRINETSRGPLADLSKTTIQAWIDGFRNMIDASEARP